jgi:hypothetical protein
MTQQDELKVGDKLRDKDPRMSHRPQLTITQINPNGVTAATGLGRFVTILRRSIYTDGKPRRSGFMLIRDGDAE